MLTKGQRIAAYLYAIDYFEKIKPGDFNDLHNGICEELWDWVRDQSIYRLNRYFNDYFPELQKHNPGFVSSDYWFPFDEPGRLKRLEVLKECLKEVEE